MSENIRKILDQFASEGIADNSIWCPILTKALKELKELEEDSKVLVALRGAGVDNWDGWDIAMETLET